MCGIVGYVGMRNAVDVLTVGLSHLEYRGYDSVGLAVHEKHQLKVFKEQGKIKNLKPLLKTVQERNPGCGIGHTRWATHGSASRKNAHPHGTEQVVLVHNGIIENYVELKDELLREGYRFTSETDSEVAAKYLDYLKTQASSNRLAIQMLCDRIVGSYAFAILFADEPNVIYGVRHGSPLCIGIGKHEMFLASDMSPILSYTNEYVLLENKEIVCIEANNFEVFGPQSNELVNKTIHFANWHQEQSDLEAFDHFMLKEIYEQPDVVKRTLRTYTQTDEFGTKNITLPIPCDFFKGIRTIHIIGCGTALYAGMCAKQWIETHTRYRVTTHIASEFRYHPLTLTDEDCVLFISQSGETADSLACLRMLAAESVKTMGIVNTQGSSIAREVDVCLYTCAGFEKAVASTKAYMGQITLLYLVSLMLQEGTHPHQALVSLMECVEAQHEVLQSQDVIEALAKNYDDISSVFFLGRGLDYTTSIEASLKLKEVAYIISDAYPAGELKHGTLALIDPKVLSVITLTQSKTKDKTISNLQEIQARSGQILLITNDKELQSLVEHVVLIPSVSEDLMPLVSIIVHQLFAYYSAKQRGCDIDCPRNLAKSVTVE